MSDVIFTPPGILSFPNLFTPRAVEQGGEPRYSCALIVDAKAMKTPAWAAVVDAVVGQAKGAFGENINLKSLKLPVKNCPDKAHLTGYEDPDGKFLSAWSKQQPGIVDANRDDIFDPGAAYPGCLARLSLQLFDYNHPTGGKGVSFALRNVQIINNDTEKFPRLDGRVAANKDFEGAGDIPSELVGASAAGGNGSDASEDVNDPF